MVSRKVLNRGHILDDSHVTQSLDVLWVRPSSRIHYFVVISHVDKFRRDRSSSWNIEIVCVEKLGTCINCLAQMDGLLAIFSLSV